MTARLRDGIAAVAALPPRRRALLAGVVATALAVGAGLWIVEPVVATPGGVAATRTPVADAADARHTLQNELAETLARLDGIASARVHLTLPERTPGSADDRHPSASVVLTIAAGRTLAAEQITAVARLVAAGVDGLAPDAVTVVDERGHVLTADRHDGAPQDGAVSVEHQRAIERATEERIESLLATVVGPGKVIARVAAAVDFARTERTEETYDPDKTVVRETRTTREATPDAKTADAKRTADAGPARTERRDETQSYEVSKTTSRTVEPVGAVKRLSVAVLIDGTYREDNGRRVFVPRTDDELAKLRTLAASAAGISDERGDRLEVTSVAFQSAAGDAMAHPSGTGAEWVRAIAPRLLAVVLVGLLLVGAMRPFARALVPARAAEVPGESVAELTRKNVALARDDPARAAALVRQWLVESREPSA